MTNGKQDLLRLICRHHLTNGNTRNRNEVGRFLAAHSDRELAESLLRHDPLYAPGKICTYGTAEDFEPIFADLRATFPDWMTPAADSRDSPKPSLPC